MAEQSNDGSNSTPEISENAKETSEKLGGDELVMLDIEEVSFVTFFLSISVSSSLQIKDSYYQ